MENLKIVLSEGPISATTLWSIKWVIKKGIINFSKYIKENLMGTNSTDKMYKDEILYL